EREERTARGEASGSRRRAVRGCGQARADARAQHVASGRGGQGAPGAGEGRECSPVLRDADGDPASSVRRVLQRSTPPPLLAAPPPRKQPARALRLGRGAATTDV